MNEVTFHLTHSRLTGPAERTVVQPWLTELSGLTLNAYAEQPPAAPGPLAMVESLVAPVPADGARIALAA